MDSLEKLDMKPWNGCYKRFVAVEASIIITRKVVSRPNGKGFNRSLIPVQAWMIARSIKRDIAYLRIRVGTFQNWVSSLWADLEVIFRHLTEKKAAQGLQHEEEELFNNIRLWYMFPLEEALEGRYEPTDKDMRVLSSRLSFQKVTVLLRIARP